MHGVLQTLLTGVVRSDTVIGNETGVDRRRVPRLAGNLADACVLLERHATERLLGDLAEAVVGSGGEALVYAEALRGDETPLKARTKSTSKGGGGEGAMDVAEFGDDAVEMEEAEEDRATQKIVQSEWVGAMLLRLPTMKHLLLTWPLLTWLQVVDRAHAERYK